MLEKIKEIEADSLGRRKYNDSRKHQRKKISDRFLDLLRW